MEPPDFIHPGGLHGEPSKNRFGFTSRASRSIGRMYSLSWPIEKRRILGIGLAFIEAVYVPGVIARPQADAADVKPLSDGSNSS